MASLICVFLVSCGMVLGHHGGATVVDEANNNTVVRVHEHARLEVILHSSYWGMHGSSRPSVLSQDGPSVLLPPPPGGCLPGVGCRPVETVFTAEHPGVAVVTASRTTCGEALLCTTYSQSHYRIVVIVTR